MDWGEKPKLFTPSAVWVIGGKGCGFATKTCCSYATQACPPLPPSSAPTALPWRRTLWQLHGWLGFKKFLCTQEVEKLQWSARPLALSLESCVMLMASFFNHARRRWRSCSGPPSGAPTPSWTCRCVRS